jgi:4'-phosphopantetheinyl transferase EntD
VAASAVVNHQRLEAGLQALLGQHAAVSCCSTDGEVGTLAPIERTAIVGAITRRQKEFAAGRAAAREAMQRLGRSASAIPAQADRSPQWPADLVGSISHSHATCISVIALKSHWTAVGVDVEPDQALSRELWNLIGLPNELKRSSAMPEAIRARWMMRIFCAKEAYYKWVYPQTLRVLEFHDVEIVMDLTLESTGFQVLAHHLEGNGMLPKLLFGRLMIDQGMVISLIVQ